ncbi:hypothetical protein [Nonomuraea sp. NPDC048916]|uniref:hypothetical protein n=1 Tax=Nonomuraea sp. NPDC048916 TaxID=3154232 RepID=UPI003405B461
MTQIDTSDHWASHRRLLGIPDEPVTSGTLDAIIVPTIRPPRYLTHAVSLARDLGCPLVALCSGTETDALSVCDVAGRDAEVVALDIRHPHDLNLPWFETSRVLPPAFHRNTDTATKRNLGLALARMLGLRRIAFLDDDITVGETGDLRRAANLLDRYSEVGLPVRSFPDNSVVCHAFRDIGGSQDTFVGGGALVVEITRSTSFFPDIYNDDWFYLLEEEGLRELAVTGNVRQSPYDPYESPVRARNEELGDVLAEGLFWLVEEGRKLNEASEPHWSEFLVRRGRFIEFIMERLGDAEPGKRERMLTSLRAARERLALITPGLCAAYLDAWRADRETWRRHVNALPAGLPLEAALAHLTLPRRAPLHAVCQIGLPNIIRLT